MLTSYSKILGSLKNYLETNMDEETINKLVKYQLENNPSWSLETANATGSFGYKSTYSMGSLQLSVVIPDNSSITNAKKQIYYYLGETFEEESKENESH